jgi:outer membrane protein assembly factor BamD (BamD/ComL family)
MKKNLILLILFHGFLFSTLEAAFTIKDGWIANANEVATLTPEKHFHIGMAALEHKDWEEAALQFRIVSSNFPTLPLGQKALFYLGAAYYDLEEYDLSNDAFSRYLKCQNNPPFFEEAITYKFNIACQLKNGAKRRFFGTKRLPKLASGSGLALEIFDEVIAAVPCHDMAAISLYAKGELLKQQYHFDESIEVFQQIIRRFPKHTLAPQSYLAISAIYLSQSHFEEQNPDLLALSEVNLRRFQQDFPRDETVKLAERNVLLLKEVYAKALYETGQFYEKTDHPKASILYYQNAIKSFPNTNAASLSEKRLIALRAFVPQNEKIEALPENT